MLMRAVQSFIIACLFLGALSPAENPFVGKWKLNRTNAFNLNHEGKFPSLIVMQPGKVFKASLWIVPNGF